MKKILPILFLIPLAALMTACLGDNYEQPNAAVFGQVVDAETGELILQDIGGEGSYIEMIELAYEKADTRKLNFKTDGTYRDNNFFNGDYKVQFNLTNFVPASVKLTSSGTVEPFGENAFTIALKGETKMDIEALPWCRIEVKDITFDEDRQRVVARFTVECTTRDALKEVGLFATLPRTYPTASTTSATIPPRRWKSTGCLPPRRSSR